VAWPHELAFSARHRISWVAVRRLIGVQSVAFAPRDTRGRPAHFSTPRWEMRVMMRSFQSPPPVDHSTQRLLQQCLLGRVHPWCRRRNLQCKPRLAAARNPRRRHSPGRCACAAGRWGAGPRAGHARRGSGARGARRASSTGSSRCSRLGGRARPAARLPSHPFPGGGLRGDDMTATARHRRPLKYVLVPTEPRRGCRVSGSHCHLSAAAHA